MFAAARGHGAVVELLMNKQGVELNALDEVSELLAYYWGGSGRFEHDLALIACRLIMCLRCSGFLISEFINSDVVFSSFTQL